jgi:serine/threonine protein kinase/tetratricopeptide (TPR) repeat protein
VSMLKSLIQDISNRFSAGIRANPSPAPRAEVSAPLPAQAWNDIETLLANALELPGPARADYLDRVCADNPAVRAQLDSLIAAHERTSALDRPVAEWIAPLAAQAFEYTPGKVVSHYEILEKLGAGGMGVVYKARDLRLDRFAALKFLPSRLADEEAKQRFLREAQAAAGLDHPNICTVLEVGETESGQLFIAMPYYEGETLKHRVARGAVDWREALSIGLQAARGLAKAHERGIIHRDIKSANLLINTDGLLKIVDFGVAKLRDVNVTRPGLTLGTLAYMSPEQARGDSVDARTDLWSLGVVLYELLAGERPFRAGTDQLLAHAIANQEPEPLSARRADIPAALERTVMRLLAKRPEQRTGSALQLLRELEPLLTDRSSLTEGSPQRTSAPWAGRGRLRRGRQVSGVRPPSRLLLGVGFTAVALIASGAAAWTVWGVRGIPLGSANTVAVLPFDVSGGQSFAYLGKGLVDLLSTKLDGAGNLQTIDARAVLGRVRQRNATNLDPQSAGSIVRELGGGLFVLGDVVEAGGELYIKASLYNAAKQTADVTAAVQGSAGDVFTLVDDLARQLVAGRNRRLSERVTQVAALTTHSLPALKAYLEGEDHLRSGRSTAALEAFKRAVAIDSTFALAYYRLSKAAEWAGDAGAQAAADRAHALGSRLSERDRQLLDAKRAFRRGNAEEAERIYRAILGKYPDEVEAWLELGEVLNHGGTLRGVSGTRARQTFERVLHYEPDHVNALLHLVRIAALENKLAELDSLVARVQPLMPEGDRMLELVALRAFKGNDSAQQAKVIEGLAGAIDWTRWLAVWNVASFAENPAGALRVNARLTESSRSVPVRVTGHILASYLEVGRGRVSAALRELDRAEGLHADAALAHGALLKLLLPGKPASTTELKQLHERLEHWTPRPDSMTGITNQYFDYGTPATLPVVKDFLLGIVEARLGGGTQALARARSLESVKLRESYGHAAQDLARTIRAEVLIASGDTAGAAREFEPARFDVWYTLAMRSPIESLLYSRWRRAQMLAAAGRVEEALVAYQAFAEVGPSDLALEAASQVERARLQERLGHRAAARHHYARFIELYQDADPDLQPQVTQARRRMAALMH